MPSLAAYLSRPKYSDQQKKVAAQHYLDHDRCLAGTLKALGYPCRDTLAAWVDELHPETKKRIVGKARRVRVFICLVLVATCWLHGTKPGTGGYMRN